MRIVTIFATLALLATALPAQEMGYIKAVGSPNKAGLFVDGKYIGPAGRFTVPEKYPIAAGSHEVRLTDPRYEDFTTTVTVNPKKTTKVKFKLKKVEPAKPPYGLIKIRGGKPESFMSVVAGDIGAVYINGKFYGHVDEFNNPSAGILIPPGTYEVSVESEHFTPVKQTVTVEANQTTYIDLEK